MKIIKTSTALMIVYIDGLMQERRNSIANALESRLSCTNLSTYYDGILPKGPYPPCLRMVDRALLAGYPWINFIVSTMTFPADGTLSTTRCKVIYRHSDAQICPRYVQMMLKMGHDMEMPWKTFLHYRPYVWRIDQGDRFAKLNTSDERVDDSLRA